MNATFALLLPVVLLAAGYAVAVLLAGTLLRLLDDAGFVTANYRGRQIPKGMGIAVPLAALLPIGTLLWWGAPVPLVSLWIALLFGMGFLGLFDDAAGNRAHGGFHQHFRALLAGRATTGALKALYGGALALFAGWSLAGDWRRGLVAAAVVALAANAVNLLDVRPGRALKGFALLAAAGAAGVAVLAEPGSWHWFHLSAGASTAGAAAALLRGDLRGEHMLGDAGSNVLGAAAGLLIAAAPLWWQGLWCLLLVLMHLYSERASLTELIERVELLRRFDRWGRSDP